MNVKSVFLRRLRRQARKIRICARNDRVLIALRRVRVYHYHEFLRCSALPCWLMMTYKSDYKMPDMVVIARDVWGTMKRRRHFLSLEWARDRRILFVEPPVSLPRLISGRPDSLSRFDTVLKPPVEVEKNIFSFTPLRPLPESVPYAPLANAAAFNRQVASAMKKAGFVRPVLWITPEYGASLLSSVSHSVSIYDITDDWTTAGITPSHRDRIVRDDALMLRRADIVFAVSESLRDSKRHLRQDVRLMPNGARIDLYEDPPPPPPPPLNSIKRPIVGYAGTVHPDRVDVSLIKKIARLASGEFSLVFIGPCLLPRADISTLESFNNIHFIPAQSMEILPAFISNFDVCSIPHLLTPFTHSLDPIKIYEYLAAGRPIVSTPVKGIMGLRDFIDIAEVAEDFYSIIKKALAGEGKSDAASRRAEAQKHTWSQRAESIDAIIRSHLENHPGQKN